MSRSNNNDNNNNNNAGAMPPIVMPQSVAAVSDAAQAAAQQAQPAAPADTPAARRGARGDIVESLPVGGTPRGDTPDGSNAMRVAAAQNNLRAVGAIPQEANAVQQQNPFALPPSVAAITNQELGSILGSNNVANNADRDGETQPMSVDSSPATPAGMPDLESPTSQMSVDSMSPATPAAPRSSVSPSSTNSRLSNENRDNQGRT
jgi:hypothetical protein